MVILEHGLRCELMLAVKANTWRIITLLHPIDGCVSRLSFDILFC